MPPLLRAAPVRRSRKLGPDVPERDLEGPEGEEVFQSMLLLMIFCRKESDSVVEESSVDTKVVS